MHAFIIWFKVIDWKLSEYWRCGSVVPERELGHALVTTHMNRRADPAALRAPIWAALMLLAVRITPPAGVTLQRSPQKNPWSGPCLLNIIALLLHQHILRPSRPGDSAFLTC